MKQLTKELFTGKNNNTLDMGRVTWGASFITICIVAGTTIMTGGAVGIAELGIALATIAAGHGAAIKMKSSTEPE